MKVKTCKVWCEFIAQSLVDQPTEVNVEKRQNGNTDLTEPVRLPRRTWVG